MYKAIIFDLDGTLLDTSKDIHKTLNDSLRRFSLPEIPYEKTLSFVGDGARKLVERAAGKIDEKLLEEVYKDYSVNFAECDNNLTSLFPKEAQTLENFKRSGIKLAIITNKPQRATERVYDKFLANFGFNIVLGQTEYSQLKPNPSSVFEILSILGVDKKDCLFVGDGETDIRTAANAGIDCVSVLWGLRSKEQLEIAGGRRFVSSFEELEKIVNF